MTYASTKSSSPKEEQIGALYLESGHLEKSPPALRFPSLQFEAFSDKSALLSQSPLTAFSVVFVLEFPVIFSFPCTSI